MISQACCTLSIIVVPTVVGIMIGELNRPYNTTGGSSNGNALFNKHPTSMPLSNCGPTLMSCLAFASQSSLDSSRSPPPFHLQNNGCLSFSIKCLSTIASNTWHRLPLHLLQGHLMVV
jgi:hypothetical protein